MKPVKHLRGTLFFLLAAMLLLTGCGPAPETVAATAAVEVAAGIAATLTAQPPATAAPTLTPRPTLTPLPTLTDQPTLTPAATLTPWPTLTAGPTYTPLPTLTPLPTATPPPTAAAVNGGGGQTGSGEAFDVRHINIMRNYLNTISGMIRVRAIYNPDRPWEVTGYDNSLLCPEYLGTFNAFQSRIITTPPAGDENVQTAFALYEQALAAFRPEAQRWADRCNQAMANGATTVRFGGGDSNDMLLIRDASIVLLDQAKSFLNAPNG